jgi:hypothetical protein
VIVTSDGNFLAGSNRRVNRERVAGAEGRQLLR